MGRGEGDSSFSTKNIMNLNVFMNLNLPHGTIKIILPCVFNVRIKNNRKHRRHSKHRGLTNVISGIQHLWLSLLSGNQSSIQPFLRTGSARR